MPKPTSNPEIALVSFREKVEATDGPILGPDKRPIHWMVKKTSTGFLFLDSALWLQSFGYGGVNIDIRHKMKDRVITDDEMVDLFQRVLDWLTLNIPKSKDWAVEFRDGCPLIPCNREVLPVLS
jgi:hypothetical protein